MNIHIIEIIKMFSKGSWLLAANPELKMCATLIVAVSGLVVAKHANAFESTNATEIVRYGEVSALPQSELRSSKSKASLSANEQDWSVETSIAVRYVVDPRVPSSIVADSGDPATFSPDRRNFFIITRRGILAEDCTEYQLLVFSVSSIETELRNADEPLRRRHAPIARTAICSQSGDFFSPGLLRPRWVTPGKIAFLGIEGGQTQGLYLFDIRNGKRSRISRSDDYVVQFVTNGRETVYVARKMRPRTGLYQYPVSEITASMLMSRARHDEAFYEVFVVGDGRVPTFVAAAVQLGRTAIFDGGGLWLSPGGRYAVAELQLEGAVPASWKLYEGNPVRDPRRAHSFVLIDLQRNIAQPVLDAPVGLATTSAKRAADDNGWAIQGPRAFWASDDSRVVLFNTALPLTKDDPLRSSMAYVIDFEPRSGRWSVLEPLADVAADKKVSSIAWTVPGKEVLISHSSFKGSPISGTLYRLTNSGWVSGEVPAGFKVAELSVRQSENMSVSVREGANDPAIVIASSDAGGEVDLLGPDSALEGVRRAAVKEVVWTDPDGRLESGGLLLPTRSSRAKPPALVIQAYYYGADKFWPDGSSSTAYAAQSLVAQGMAVLFMDIPGDAGHPDVTMADQGPYFVKRIDAAVEMLASKGIIDASRVGVVGFSRGGLMTYIAATNPGRTRLVAAVVADGATGSFGEYLADGTWSSGSDGTHEYEQTYHGNFWDNKDEWLTRAPSFNVDRVEAPILFAYNGKGALAHLDEHIGAFRLNRAPADFVLFPFGTHQLIRPKERYASLSLTVDWMNFWLQHKEDSSPLKESQYRRWRELRKMAGERDARSSAETERGGGEDEDSIQNDLINVCTSEDSTRSWVAGRDYFEIVPRRHRQLKAGKVELIYRFLYTRGREFERRMQEWMRTKPDYIEVVREVDNKWRHTRYQAQMYYTLEKLGRLDLHGKFYDWVMEPAHDQPVYHKMVNPDLEAMFNLNRQFAKINGIDEGKFIDVYKSEDIELKVLNQETEMRDTAEAQIVINGTYGTSLIRMYHTASEEKRSWAEAYSRLFRLIEHLAAQEHQGIPALPAR